LKRLVEVPGAPGEELHVSSYTGGAYLVATRR
jgi:hypothetical protein